MGQVTFDFQPQRNIYSVSGLTVEIRNLLESSFRELWVMGEVSNFRAAASGHLYFTLKDASAQLRAVCFRGQARYLRFKPQDGISVIARGSLAVYAERGEYQLLVEHLEPAGLGALQLAFEQLKLKLAAEGLFDPARKRPLPVLPRTLGVITSPTGAVIRDILRVLHRRFRNMNVLIYPVRVQGDGAAQEIAEGIAHFNHRSPVDVLILARGGGSLEDLWAFNEEVVARAIAASGIPVVSAVGHETDFTIADFVADLRAPTPSAAAELVVHRKQDFESELEHHGRRLQQVLRLKLSEGRQRLTELSLHRVFQTLAARIAEKTQRVDDLAARLHSRITARLTQAHTQWLGVSAGVARYDFRQVNSLRRFRVEDRIKDLETRATSLLADRLANLERLRGILHERSPLGILNRGYSITRDAAGKVIRDASAIEPGSEIAIRLAQGELGASVTRRKTQ
ncbi:MAG TPA: exodeoxyribonuclease VII large subunit [Terriglobia bacterium]|nr:exodeoxyribonuclease VII large subunit [Terriglobia bacterium]